jgi:hypothetical protein
MKKVVYSGDDIRAKFAKYYGLEIKADWLYSFQSRGFLLQPKTAKPLEAKIYTVAGLESDNHEQVYNVYKNPNRSRR